MTSNVSKPPFTGAFLIGCLAQIFIVVSIATQAWTIAHEVQIGLWSLTDEAGYTYSWIDTGAYYGGTCT